MRNILESRNLNKICFVGDKIQQNILKDVNLQINEGEFVSLMGSSGSGKSTLLYSMSGMDTISSGSVIFNGEELSGLSEKQLSKIRLNKMGFIFQQTYLLKNLSIYDNIVLPAHLAKKNYAQTKIKAIEMMDRMNIAGLADHDITQASGGQLQRVSICRALINDPDIVFGDEPTGALNSKSANDIMDIFLDINHSGTTILLATHDMKVASKTERVLYMLDGKIVAECFLGKYTQQEDSSKERENILSNWLVSMGF